jgi:5'-3' exonuclease
MTPKETAPKRLFLVDAMGYIFRAFYAPMDRLQTSSGIPTKVPYLFATMMRRLIHNKDLRPDYVAVVFDVSAPTFRDKLFASYKAQRPPMPEDLSRWRPRPRAESREERPDRRREKGRGDHGRAAGKGAGRDGPDGRHDRQHPRRARSE